MSWKVHTVNRSRTDSQLWMLLSKGTKKLISVVSPNASTPECFENNIISAFDKSQTKEWKGQREAIQKLVGEAMDFSESKGFFREQDLRPESVLSIHTHDGAIQAKLNSEKESYTGFCSLLRPQNKIIKSTESGRDVILQNKSVSYDEIIYGGALPSWRMTSMKASIVSAPNEEFVYKGLSFYHYQVCGPEIFQHEVIACYREIEMVNHFIGKHPNVIPPAQYLVYASPNADNKAEHLICGSLYRFLNGGSLADFLDRTANQRTRLPLVQKAKWCYQLCSAMFHVHSKAGVWHQDLKPPNVLISDDEDVLIADWEQCGANPFILAPEADGTFDVRELNEEVSGGRQRLQFHKYEGPERINSPIGAPLWNSFPGWIKDCPRAAELAEVFSLGRTMWVLLEQVGLEHEPGVTDYSTQVIQWSSWSDDIPASWKRIVEASMAEDPNERPLMKELVEFWEQEWKKLQ
ncbi:hypothetical protein AA313_de0204154 [Arthrobotrys entomopaga]|nr:hypothetical protein AA313_de0204154 [Arthrobotrys entomopaga]